MSGAGGDASSSRSRGRHRRLVRRGRGDGPEAVPGPAYPAVPVPMIQLPTGLPGGSATEQTSATEPQAPPPPEPVNPLQIWIYQGTLIPSGPVSSLIRETMVKRMEPGACTFADVSPGRLQEWWETFQRNVRWDPTVTNDYLVYKLFVQRAGT
ncbi:hypothetical protein ACS0TY_023290 [Phlomoides rotata]